MVGSKDGTRGGTWDTSGAGENEPALDEGRGGVVMDSKQDDLVVTNKTIADGLLHRLWTKAVGTEGYDKEEWKALEREIWDRGTLRGARKAGRKWEDPDCPHRNDRPCSVCLDLAKAVAENKYWRSFA